MERKRRDNVVNKNVDVLSYEVNSALSRVFVEQRSTLRFASFGKEGPQTPEQQVYNAVCCNSTYETPMKLNKPSVTKHCPVPFTCDEKDQCIVFHPTNSYVFSVVRSIFNSTLRRFRFKTCFHTPWNGDRNIQSASAALRLRFGTACAALCPIPFCNFCVSAYHVLGIRLAALYAQEECKV